ncbi:hydrolase CocE/NonD family protein [Colletotrichum scovillei]|uniref:hydrolase CocE/NonD family protein n=1 Tax=Colletotrichum scovillei TaxID=1209932 RepID=UPI0015C3D4A6|nr:hydrolase CocE/NonD family protein [Colletotrichum scovillei]KAF4778903.1 hydrolase CocE/NonD family protein [Colletotrichum scovillei]KAG7046235.1 CocE/NonD family hydrolase [Colletotrichum scovillei]
MRLPNARSSPSSWLTAVVLLGTVYPASSFAQNTTTGAEIVQGSLRIYGNDSYPIIQRRPLPLDAARARYPGFKQENLTLKAGTIRRDGALTLPCDILFERDVPVTLRDGITVYTDIFRPTTGNATVPSIIAWSPYGKEIGGQWLDDVEGRSGVKLSSVSELQKFEGPDPAYWVCKGYSILNPDNRGAYSSEGNITYWGRQLGEDGYDFVEWAAEQAWSSGKVAFSGNSWLAVSQWFIAAEHPPHLTAIAPWEGLTDLYRDTAVKGGIPAPGFQESILTTFAGKEFVEDVPRILLSEGLITPYWEDKIASLEKIKVPAYIVASYTNLLHTHGSFEAFRRIASDEKWLRVHNTQEWTDYYTSEHVADLQKFFDFYLKGEDNGWQSTPRVRLAVLDPGSEDTLDRVVADWPVPGLQSKTLYLQPNNSLGEASLSNGATLSYNSSLASGVTLNYRIPENMELIGYSKLRLWVSSPDSTDMDISISVQKLSSNGTAFPSTGSESSSTIGPTGALRLSHRELDTNRSTDLEPFLLHTSEKLLSPGEIVPVDIPLWPVALRFHAGELLSLNIAPASITPTQADIGFGTAIVPVPSTGGTFEPGQNASLIELGGAMDSNPAFVNEQRVETPVSRNKGMHFIHVGGKYDSFLLFPVNSTIKTTESC